MVEVQKIKKLFKQIRAIKENDWDSKTLNKILRSYRKENGQLYRNDELVDIYNTLLNSKEIEKDQILEERLRLKPTRTNSGVAVVTVLTKPYPCPGKCIYCPNDTNMPKSYISSEPGAQRALKSKFDPYAQVYNRVIALKKTGHNVQKIELIVLGGSWSAYPLNYQIWFVSECFRALNDLTTSSSEYTQPKENSYIETSWATLIALQQKNQTAYCRNVGLVFETRPDLITEDEVKNMKRLGATKIQLGIQTLDDTVLKKNMILRSIEDGKKAFAMLRQAGFKMQAHWMLGLYNSTPDIDIDGYRELWTKDYCPDELKIYPTSVIKNTALHNLYMRGDYKPYTTNQLTEILEKTLPMTPRYCRISRVIRDIPSDEIEAGSNVTNLRQIVESNLEKKGVKIEDIRAREIKQRKVSKSDIKKEIIEYDTSVSKEFFISFKTIKDDKICAFLRLSIPNNNLINKNYITELNNCSLIREIHVYGKVVGITERSEGHSQHLGLGKNLVKIAQEISKKHNIQEIAVISAIGTREYYKKLGFELKEMYMIKTIL